MTWGRPTPRMGRRFPFTVTGFRTISLSSRMGRSTFSRWMPTAETSWTSCPARGSVPMMGIVSTQIGERARPNKWFVKKGESRHAPTHVNPWLAPKERARTWGKAVQENNYVEDFDQSYLAARCCDDRSTSCTEH